MAETNSHNKALREAQEAISRLAPIRQLEEELRAYPISLLRQICEEYSRRGSPVPDHVLQMPPYIGETALRALLEGNLVERIEDQRFAIYAYQPTSAGQAMIDRIDADASDRQEERRRKSG